ncbi:hypothetical protein DH2020_046981 [Rehmannia glutinosa]|uniref:Peptidase A1 domain-containing protein n=1 Tax=Rehmannia glutinosa TaxID=99300 RepID=A0ABR0UAF1_REHGL
MEKYLVMTALISLHVSLTKASTNGFTTDLIHRDSPQSPSYDPSLSRSQCLANAFRRSFHRAQRFNADARSTPKPELIDAHGEYLMKYSIGTPPVPSFGCLDTGSDIIWTQCKPCLKCFNQNLTLFNPKTSSTYKTIRCNTSECDSMEAGITSCSRTRKNCLYYEPYEDGSFTHGLVSTETLTFASNRGKRVISIPNVIFGCGFRNHMFFVGGESGIIGLGVGNVSLVRQLGPLARGKFSYCLVSILSEKSNSSKLNFGAKARVRGRGVVSTPLARRKLDTSYFVTVEGISVGNRRFKLIDDNDAAFSGDEEGNMIVDSGTTLTLLPLYSYMKTVEALNSRVKLKQIKDPQGLLDLCYFAPRKEDSKLKFPRFIFHFRGGADLKLKQDNIFVRTSNVSVCLAAQPFVFELFGIIGNLAQANFLVGFDLNRRTVSFKPTHCDKK